MKNKWIKKSDKVLVLSGNDKGKVGEVLSRSEQKILVQGVNVRKKHIKRRDENSRSEIVSIERPVDISNVALCDKDGNKLKLKVSVNKEGKKTLVYTKGGKEQIHRSL